MVGLQANATMTGTVEVVESARVPDTADIMAEYLVDINGDGDLAGYKRGARYFRGQTREE